MTAYISAKLPKRIIVVTRDCDHVLSVRRRDPDTNNPVDWGTNVSVFMRVDVSRSAPTTVAGTVNGSLATVRLESSLLDTVRNGTPWRLIVSQAGSPSLETAVMVGVFERNDGK